MLLNIRQTAKVNCKTTKAWRGLMVAFVAIILPLSTLTGLNDERKSAG
jgi:hypothetical protein